MPLHEAVNRMFDSTVMYLPNSRRLASVGILPHHNTKHETLQELHRIANVSTKSSMQKLNVLADSLPQKRLNGVVMIHFMLKIQWKIAATF